MTVMITIVYLVLKSVLNALHNTHSGPGNAMFTKHIVASPSDLEKTLNEKCDHNQLLEFVAWLRKQTYE